MPEPQATLIDVAPTSATAERPKRLIRRPARRTR
jgi:hypothetical protein